LCAWANLAQAYTSAARGKRGRATTAGFELYLADNLLEIQADLLAQNYQPGGYHSFFIHEPKRRLISAAPFRDRVVHHLVSWLLPLTMGFPKCQRFTVTSRLQNAALNFQELIVEANIQRGSLRAEKLREADAELLKTRLYLRLCERWKWLSPGQS
jgi:hypothetical protein